MKCPFCGAEFDKARTACESCPLNKGCKATCCQHCGYELERESKLADLLKKVLKPGERASG